VRVALGIDAHNKEKLMDGSKLYVESKPTGVAKK
jgi:hypothetical protein